MSITICIKASLAPLLLTQITNTTGVIVYNYIITCNCNHIIKYFEIFSQPTTLAFCKKAVEGLAARRIF